MSEIKYPHVKVRLTGTDGNAFAILGKVAAALRRAGASKDDIKSFQNEATSGDYSHLLATCSAWVTVS